MDHRPLRRVRRQLWGLLVLSLLSTVAGAALGSRQLPPAARHQLAGIDSKADRMLTSQAAAHLAGEAFIRSEMSADQLNDIEIGTQRFLGIMALLVSFLALTQTLLSSPLVEIATTVLLIAGIAAVIHHWRWARQRRQESKKHVAASKRARRAWESKLASLERETVGR